MLWAILTLGIVVDHAHLVSPIMLAWSNQGFREHMLQRPEKFVLLPVLLLMFGFVFGLEVPYGSGAFKALGAVYLIWNSYHFGMQNFGLLALAGRRGLGFVAACATMLAMSVLPLSIYGGVLPVLVIMAVVDWAHWLSDIGLSTFVTRRRSVFLGGVALLGFLGFVYKHYDVTNHAVPSVALSLVSLAISLRFCAGFIHFLYSRWVWKLSDPQVRATIGRDLLGVQP
jgi:hypothetical protein